MSNTTSKSFKKKRKPTVIKPKALLERKTVKIVFEDQGDVKGHFRFYALGLDRVGKVPESALTAAERAAADMFQLILDHFDKHSALGGMDTKGDAH